MDELSTMPVTQIFLPSPWIIYWFPYHVASNHVGTIPISAAFTPHNIMLKQNAIWRSGC